MSSDPGLDAQRITFENLRWFIHAVLVKTGVPEEVASVEADIAAEVDLFGVQSHGVQLLPTVVEHVEKGLINPAPKLQPIADFGASVLFDCNRGIGRYVSALAMDEAVRRAARFGVGLVCLRGVSHWGRGHSYALRAARQGVIGLAFTNAMANFPAWGTSVPTLGNNPIAIGIPARNREESAVLDIAMTQSAVRRVWDAAAAGQQVPVDWGLDADGRSTTDPNAIIRSERYLPMGRHKGSGLAFMTDLLTAGLAGGALCFEQGRNDAPSDMAGASSKTFIAFRPFGDWLESRTEDLKEHLKSAPRAEEQGEPLWPGEGSYRRRLDYLRNGIPINGHLVAKLEVLADQSSISIPWIRQASAPD